MNKCKFPTIKHKSVDYTIVVSFTIDKIDGEESLHIIVDKYPQIRFILFNVSYFMSSLPLFFQSIKFHVVHIFPRILL